MAPNNWTVVTNPQIRDLFNIHILPLLQRDQLKDLSDIPHDPSPGSHCAPGVKSLEVHLYTSSLAKVAICHCFRLPDGSMRGPQDVDDAVKYGRGQLDPKQIEVDGKMYKVRRTPQTNQ